MYKITVQLLYKTSENVLSTEWVNVRNNNFENIAIELWTYINNKIKIVASTKCGYY